MSLSANSPRIEVVMPLRNPTAVLRQSIASLASQSTREFSVCLSDNWSVKGQELFDEAEAQLRAAGVATRRVRPPLELGRIEHWNWSHHQCAAEWIKPLFAGDWLGEAYVATTRAAIVDHPAVDVVNCTLTSHFQDGFEHATPLAGGFHSPEEVLASAFRDGNRIGGPQNICLRKSAFTTGGGYPPALPVSADYWVYLLLALRNGLATCPEPLAHFNYHPDRFSTSFPLSRIHAEREELIILLAASSHADFAGIPAQYEDRNRFFLHLGKRRLKARLRKALDQRA
jgi:hypothetical protein